MTTAQGPLSPASPGIVERCIERGGLVDLDRSVAIGVRVEHAVPLGGDGIDGEAEIEGRGAVDTWPQERQRASGECGGAEPVAARRSRRARPSMSRRRPVDRKARHAPGRTRATDRSGRADVE